MKTARLFLILLSFISLTVSCGGDGDSDNDSTQRETDDGGDDTNDTRVLRSTDCFAEGPDTRDVGYKVTRERRTGETDSEIFFYDCRTTNDCVRQFELNASRRVMNGDEQLCYSNGPENFNACTNGEAMIVDNVDNVDGTSLELYTFEGNWNGSRHIMHCERDYPRL